MNIYSFVICQTQSQQLDTLRLTIDKRKVSICQTNTCSYSKKQKTMGRQLLSWLLAGNDQNQTDTKGIG